jgi:hypothetical protein
VFDTAGYNLWLHAHSQGEGSVLSAELALSHKGWASDFVKSDMVHIGFMLLNEWTNASCARSARTKSVKSRTREERRWAREDHRLKADAA